MNFKNHMLLTEKIGKADIIDAYILMSMPNPSDPANAFTAAEISQKAHSAIISEITSILMRELRHIDDMTEDYYNIRETYNGIKYYYKNPNKLKSADKDDQAIFREEVKRLKSEAKKIFGVEIEPPDFINGLEKTVKYLHKIYGYEQSKKYEKGEGNIYDMANYSDLPWSLEAIENMFKKWGWEDGYGGANWASIAKQARLLTAGDKADFFKRLDRFVDYVHNSGAVMNKFEGYDQGWLLFILDLKAQALNIRDLIPYASPEVRKLFKDHAWRMMLRQIPGLGASESNQAYKALIKKYVTAAAKGTSSSDDEDPDTHVDNLGKEIGWDSMYNWTVELANEDMGFKKVLIKYLKDFLTWQDWESRSMSNWKEALVKEFNI